MGYERSAKGITYRGIRRAFCDEANTNEALVRMIDKRVGGHFIAASHGAYMKNQGTDLHMIVGCPDGSEGYVRLAVELDSVKADGFMDLTTKFKVKKYHEGAERMVTIAPRIWFQHSGNAAEAENRLTFEKLLKIASPAFEDALRDGIERAERGFPRLMKPKSPIPWWMMTK